MRDLKFEDFVDELIESGWRPVHDENHEKIRAFWQGRQPDGYDASCIKILPRLEIEARFPWERIQSLAHEYKRDPKWIEQGIEACRRSSVDPRYFIEKYLKKNVDIPKNQLVTDAYLEITRSEKTNPTGENHA